MSIESGGTNSQELSNNEATEKESVLQPEMEEKNLTRIRQNIAKLIESGKLTPELAEKLAKLNLTEQIEITQEGGIQEEQYLITKENGQVNFGVDDNGESVVMPVFQPEAKNWQPKFFPTKDNRYLRVGFAANDGTEFLDPDNSQVTNDDDVSNPEVQAAISIEERKLQSHLAKERSKRHSSPERRTEFRETEDSVETMKKIARLLNRQEKMNRGNLIIEGEAGTGKNWMIDHIAHLTERPVFRFTCDASKETPELKYFLEFVTDEKGSRTVRVSSTLVEALQTEGAILELDEINTLKPDVAKSLNSLFDADRAIYFGEDDVKAKAARGVLLVGLMNPAHYVGVKPLAETIKSRSRIITVDYPKLEGEDDNGDQILLSNEAEMIYQYFPEFGGINQTEFQGLWHQIVNGKESKSAQNLLNQSRQTRVGQIKTLVKIGNKLRDAYRQYQEEGSGDQLDYNFTLRETAECALELADHNLPQDDLQAENQVKMTIKEIFIPKLDTPEERKRIEALIEEI